MDQNASPKNRSKPSAAPNAWLGKMGHQQMDVEHLLLPCSIQERSLGRRHPLYQGGDFSPKPSKIRIQRELEKLPGERRLRPHRHQPRGSHRVLGKRRR